MLKSILFLLIVNFVWLSQAETICEDNKAVNDNYTISNVKAKYNKGENVNEIFKWIDSCLSIENQITGYNTLYKQIAKNKKGINYWTLKFALTLSPLMQNLQDVDKPYVTILSNLFYKIPNCAIALANYDQISIKSVGYGEYLVASELKENGASEKRNVFFKNLTKENNADTKWRAKIDEEGRGVYLELENVHYKETLIVSWLTNNYGEHIVYTKVNGEKNLAQWILEPVDEYGDQCIFFNPNSRQYLCVYDERFYEWTHYRRIFTTNSKKLTDPACHFSVN